MLLKQAWNLFNLNMIWSSGKNWRTCTLTTMQRCHKFFFSFSQISVWKILPKMYGKNFKGSFRLSMFLYKFKHPFLPDCKKVFIISKLRFWVIQTLGLKSKFRDKWKTSLSSAAIINRTESWFQDVRTVEART